MAGPKRGAFNLISMVLAFGAIGGFLYWLTITAVPTEIAVAVEEETAQAVSLTAFGQNPTMYADNLIAVDGIEVESLLASRAFFVALPDGSPYPIRLDPSLGVGQVAPGDQGRVTGTVHMMTDSVLDQWAQEAIFADDEQREAAGASGSFLLATEVDLAGDTQGGDGGPDA